MKTKKLWSKIKKTTKRLGRDLGKSPLGRASRGKHTRGFI